MSDELDVNEIAANVATQLIENTGSRVSRLFSSQIDKLKVHFRVEFEDYVKSSLTRTSRVKTLIHPDEEKPLSDLYVPLTFRNGVLHYSDNHIIERVRDGEKILISGTAGGGKSILIKHLNTSLLSDYRGLLPIYYELRYTNGEAKRPLLDLVHDSVCAHIPSLNRELFEEGLKAGRFALVLDGFDEIDHERRPVYGDEIRELCERFPKMPVAITARPEENLPGLSGFSIYHARPMDKDQCLSLLSKIEYDPEKKTRFIDEVDDYLFDRHEEFLSNPLMTSMMFLTYSYHSDIPEKIHIFYQQAFETLFQRHDRSKGVYTRRSYSKLSIDVFQRIFEAFCALSYMEEKLVFDESTILRLLNTSASYSSSNVSAELILRDLLESTCLMQRDGVYITFVHRSFQEYFTAKFISSLDDTQARAAIDAILGRQDTDNTIDMLFDLNQQLIERVWILDNAKKLVNLIGKNTSKVTPQLTEVFGYAGVTSRSVTLMNKDGYLGRTALLIWRLYKVYDKEGKPRGRVESKELLAAIDIESPLGEELRKICRISKETMRKAKTIPRNTKSELVFNFQLHFDCSDTLLSALDFTGPIGKEYRAWVRVIKDIEAENASRSRLLKTVFGKS